MTDSSNERGYSDILKSLHDFVSDPSDDVARMPLNRIDAELAAEGIDVSPHVSAMKTRIAKLLAQQELEQADRQHAKFREKETMGRDLFRNIGQTLSDAFISSTPELAYFRNLTDVTEETKHQLAEDAALLKDFDADDKLDERS